MLLPYFRHWIGKSPPLVLAATAARSHTRARTHHQPHAKDLGFYAFHRACHMHRGLYKAVHRDHHVDTAKKYGRLVAYETYTITWLETISITASYFIGLMLVLSANGFAPITVFELATLITWGHSVELLGHTAMTTTPRHHPMRLIVELCGLDLLVLDHTMHHKVPMSNFSKRMTLWDRAFGTYEPRDESLVFKAGDGDALQAAQTGVECRATSNAPASSLRRRKA